MGTKSEGARAGEYFLRPMRNKAQLLEVCRYDAITRQTIPVAKTGTSDLALAEVALNRFVLNDSEAKARERVRREQGLGEEKAIDRPVLEALNLYYLGHAEKRPGSLPRAVRATIKMVQGAWPENPKCSLLDRDMQKAFVAHGRAQGLADNTIAFRLTVVFTAMHWCDVGGLLQKYPRKIRQEEWEANLTSSTGGAFSLEELAKLFIAAREDQLHWRYLVTAVATCSRPTAIIELGWNPYQMDLQHRVCTLNPEGRQQTKKRRATIKMCSTFHAEAASWTRDHERVIGMISTGFFRTLTGRAGVTGGPMRIRHTMRTWLATQGVPDPEADIFMGHAEEGSDTGRRFYKHLQPDYLIRCAAAIEKLFVEISRRTGICFAGMQARKPEPAAAAAAEEIIARALKRLQSLDVPREPWHWELSQILQTPQIPRGALAGAPVADACQVRSIAA